MKKVLFFILSIVCDNIELASREFDELKIGSHVIKSNEMKKYNSVKISFQGTSIFKLKETKPRIFELYDSTVYFNRVDTPNIRVDFEMKSYGLADFVWRFALFLIFVSIASAYLIHRILQKTTKRNLAKSMNS